jgi:hypothetical protein
MTTYMLILVPILLLVFVVGIVIKVINIWPLYKKKED